MQAILTLSGKDNVINPSKSHLKFCLCLRVLIRWGRPKLCSSGVQIVIITFISSELGKLKKNFFP